MNEALIYVVLGIDVLLVLILLRQRRTPPVSNDIGVVTEERHMLQEIRSAIRDDIMQIDSKNRETLKRVSEIATEVELELRNGKSSLSAEVDIIIQKLAEKLNEPLKRIQDARSHCEGLLRRLDKSRNVMSKLITRGEIVLSGVTDRVSAEEAIEELMQHKYDSALELLSKGTSREEICKDLNMTPRELDLLTQSST